MLEKTAEEIVESSPSEELTPDQKLNKLITESPYKENLVIEHQEELVEILVESWNNIIKLYENQTIAFAIKCIDLMKGYPDKTISVVVEKVRNHPKLLQPAHSKDRIMQGIRLIKERRDLIGWGDLPEEKQKELPFLKKPYRKRDGNIFWEFYFQLYKYQMDPGIRLQFEEDAKKNLWSVRKLKAELSEYFSKLKTPYTARRFQKRDLIREIIIMLKDLEPQDLTMLKEVIKEQFNTKLESYRKWIAKKEEFEKE